MKSEASERDIAVSGSLSSNKQKVQQMVDADGLAYT